MTPQPYLLGIDQGSSGSRALVMDSEGQIRGYGYCLLPRLYPRPGWVEQDPDTLVGAKASTLKWKLRKKEDGQLPWINSLDNGIKKIGVALNLSTPHMGIRAMSTNSAPILDDAGKTRGALVTFDDITDVEESNILLENAVTTLQKNDAEIRHSNARVWHGYKS